MLALGRADAGQPDYFTVAVLAAVGQVEDLMLEGQEGLVLVGVGQEGSGGGAEGSGLHGGGACRSAAAGVVGSRPTGCMS